MSDNQAQIDYWNGRTGERWKLHQAAMDRVITPLGERALAHVTPTPSMRALDVGCGCGDTTLALAELIGERGHITGVDVSTPMLGRARERVATRTDLGAPIDLVLADAAEAKLPTVDLIFSRFGVMFFADPVRAFRHLHAALAPQGRLAFVCWRASSENAWARISTSAIEPHLVPEPPPEPNAPGPFAFADRDRLQKILHDAGYWQISIERYDADLLWTRSPSLADGVEFFTNIGPVSRRLAEAEPATNARAIESLSKALAPHMTPHGLELGSSVWIVTANA